MLGWLGCTAADAPRGLGATERRCESRRPAAGPVPRRRPRTRPAPPPPPAKPATQRRARRLCRRPHPGVGRNQDKGGTVTGLGQGLIHRHTPGGTATHLHRLVAVVAVVHVRPGGGLAVQGGVQPRVRLWHRRVADNRHAHARRQHARVGCHRAAAAVHGGCLRRRGAAGCAAQRGAVLSAVSAQPGGGARRRAPRRRLSASRDGRESQLGVSHRRGGGKSGGCTPPRGIARSAKLHPLPAL